MAGTNDNAPVNKATDRIRNLFARLSMTIMKEGLDAATAAEVPDTIVINLTVEDAETLVLGIAHYSAMREALLKIAESAKVKD